VNPSRAALSAVKLSLPAESQRQTVYVLRANAANNFSYAVFTSVLAITSSTLPPSVNLGNYQYVAGVLCTQEWERFCAFFCAVFKETELRAQIYEDAISITTRAKLKEGGK